MFPICFSHDSLFMFCVIHDSPADFKDHEWPCLRYTVAILNSAHDHLAISAAPFKFCVALALAYWLYLFVFWSYFNAVVHTLHNSLLAMSCILCFFLQVAFSVAVF